jgi:hypothetical protein
MWAGMEATPWILLAAVTVWAVAIAWAWEWLDRRDERVSQVTRAREPEPMSDYYDTYAALATRGRFSTTQDAPRRARSLPQPVRVAAQSGPERLLAARRSRGGR